MGGLGEVVEDEVEEFFAFFWGGEVGATGEAFVCALVHVAAYEHAVKVVGDEFTGVGELGWVDEFGAKVKHEGGFEFAGVTDKLLVAFEDSGLRDVEDIPVTACYDEGVGEGELELSGYDSHGVDVAAVSVEEEDALEVVFE